MTSPSLMIPKHIESKFRQFFLCVRGCGGGRWRGHGGETWCDAWWRANLVFWRPSALIFDVVKLIFGRIGFVFGDSCIHDVQRTSSCVFGRAKWDGVCNREAKRAGSCECDVDDDYDCVATTVHPSVTFIVSLRRWLVTENQHTSLRMSHRLKFGLVGLNTSHG